MSSDVLFFLTNGPKNKNIQITVMYDKEKHSVIICEEVKRATFCHFCLKTTNSINWLKKQLPVCFLFIKDDD